MELSYLIVVLFLATMSAVLIFALVSKYKTEQRLKDDNAPKSTLAKDGPNH
jgi:hypothetical protein